MAELLTTAEERATLRILHGLAVCERPQDDTVFDVSPRTKRMAAAEQAALDALPRLLADIATLLAENKRLAERIAELEAERGAKP